MPDNPFAPALLIEERGPVRIVTMNRPDTLNAVSSELCHAMAGVWRYIPEDPGARAIVLTGAGRAFSAGGDLNLFRRIWTDVDERALLIAETTTIFHSLLDCPLPIVAAINGPAVGLGCTLGVLCDLVYIAESAYISDPHVSVGLTAGDGGAAFWPLTVGIAKAKELLFFGSRLSAQEAVDIGLANGVVADGEILDKAVEVAERLAALPAQALRTTKRAVNLYIKQAATSILDYALAAEYVSYDTPEHRAAVERLQKRQTT
jgi:enoyl-CoA hydratase